MLKVEVLTNSNFGRPEELSSGNEIMKHMVWDQQRINDDLVYKIWFGNKCT